MLELNNFYNEGFGWICRRCEDELGVTPAADRSRLLREGEAESKHPELSSRALAKWEDQSQRVLVCPRCGISEAVEKS
jgi:rubrerythrin